MTPRTVGVEEELHLVDPDTRRAVSAADTVLARTVTPDGTQLDPEIKRSMLETGSRVCESLGDLRADLHRLRDELRRVAAAEGLCLASCGILPTSDWRDSEVTSKERYLRMSELYGQVLDEQIVCGLHVHVGMEDRDVALAVLNRAGPWLAPLLALTASSPFHEARDTGFASFRTIVWDRWTTANLPGHFADVDEYDRLVDALVETGTILDEGQIYWPVRLSRRYPTIEFRIGDAVPSVDEAVLQAALTRGIVEVLADDVHADRPPRLPYSDVHRAGVRTELVRAATWQAARHGVEGELLDLGRGERVPASDALRALVDQLRGRLEDAGDLEVVEETLGRLLRDGAPAQRLRAAASRGGLDAATDRVVAETSGR